MASDDTSGPTGGFDFEEIRKLLEQMGLGSGDMDFNQLLEQVARMQASGAPAFAMTNADKDPDAAWRTTITAAQQLTQSKGPDPHLDASERALLVDSERLAQSWLSEHTTFSETGLASAAIPAMAGAPSWSPSSMVLQMHCSVALQQRARWNWAHCRRCSPP